MTTSWTMILRKDHGILIDSEISKSIFKAIHQPTQQTICVKSTPLLSSSSINEAYILRTVLADDDHHTVHPNIVSLLSVKYLPLFSLGNSAYFIFDYAQNRDLATHGLLHGGTEKQLTAEQMRTYLCQLLSAIMFCHDRLVYHCAIEFESSTIVCLWTITNYFALVHRKYVIKNHNRADFSSRLNQFIYKCHSLNQY